MPTEVLRCSDCNMPLKAVPAWLASTHVKFTCNSCPKRSSRPAAARFETPVEVRTPIIGDPDLDLEDAPEGAEEIDMDVSLEDLDEPKDDKDPE